MIIRASATTIRTTLSSTVVITADDDEDDDTNFSGSREISVAVVSAITSSEIEGCSFTLDRDTAGIIGAVTWSQAREMQRWSLEEPYFFSWGKFEHFINIMNIHTHKVTFVPIPILQ